MPATTAKLTSILNTHRQGDNTRGGAGPVRLLFSVSASCDPGTDGNLTPTLHFRNLFASGAEQRAEGGGAAMRQVYNLTRLSRNALVTTDTELSAMAAPAKTGDSSKPKAG